MHNCTVLNPISSPIDGNVLIEASAGTGKTYTITTLVLRLLLGIHSPYATPLAIDEILVVTFTNAATAELKKRIYERIVALRTALMKGYDSDETLMALLDLLKGKEQWAHNRLLLAERTIDHAKIFTIHGFCQRILSQNTLESKLSAQTTLVPSFNALFLQATKQFWRKHCYRFAPELAAYAFALYQSPEKLLKKLHAFLNLPHIHSKTPIPLNETALNEVFTQAVTTINALKCQWCTEMPQLAELLRHTGINKRIYSARNLPNWIDSINAWANSQSAFPLPQALVRFSQQTLIDAADTAPPEALLFKNIERLLATVTEANMDEQLLQFARVAINYELNLLKNTHDFLSFNDILFYTKKLLQHASVTLLDQLRHDYKVALIDEFQDTDQNQFAIFQTLFSQAHNHTLLMIGDPKQSIYKFRGADIYAYLNAKQAVRHSYTLNVNYRSSTSVVAGINALFGQNTRPFLEQQIPFIAVNTPPSADTLFLSINQAPQQGLSFCYLNASLSNSQYLEEMAKQTALEVQTLLACGQLHEGSIARPVIAQDIALIVRSGTEASVLKKALARHKINAAYLSEQATVFHGQAALDLVIFLNSLLNPTDYALIRRCLASSLYQLSLVELKHCLDDSEPYEAIILERNQLIELWNTHGILAMIHKFIQSNDRLLRIRNNPLSERLLMDILHLGELLQTQSFALATHEALVLWLEEMINNKGDNGTDAPDPLRLESEHEAITIITIHKSKGLEYPIVFIPFALSLPTFNEYLYHDQSTHKLYLAFNKTQAIAEQIAHETAAENLRLLYVALTRAKYFCRVGVVQTLTRNQRPVIHKTALGYLFNCNTEKDPLVLINDRSDQPWAVMALPTLTPSDTNHIMAQESSTNLVAATLTHSIARSWHITSFSHLTRQVQHASFDNHHNDHDLAILDDQPAPEPYSIFSFPKGAHVGNLIHTLLENAAPAQLTDPLYINEQLSRSVLQQELAEALDLWSQVLAHWFTGVFNAPLNTNVTLAQVLKQNVLHELAFFFPIHKPISAAGFNQLLNAQKTRQQPAALTFFSLEGMVKGFIDLTFKWQDQFYIVDYKSNHLGNHHHNYHHNALQLAIDTAYYDAQYLIYTLALKRYLQRTVKNFDYDKHFGGIYYLFVRGMHEAGTEGIYFIKPEAQLIEQLEHFFTEGGL